MIHALAGWDSAVVEAFQDARWGPVDWVFVLLSAWWVKSLVIVGVGGAADVAVRRRIPLAALYAAGSLLAAAGLAELLKHAFHRLRPPLADPAIHPLGSLPHSYSLPSGHAATAFAAAAAIGFLHPRLRRPLLALAAFVGLSRIWLGVHYPTDVVVGALLGVAVAWVAWLVYRAAAARGAARAGAAIIGPRTS